MAKLEEAGAKVLAQGTPSPVLELYRKSLRVCMPSGGFEEQTPEVAVSAEGPPVVVAEVADTDGSFEVAIDDVKS